MTKHVWTIICRESVINRENNALSLMNVFEGLQIEIGKEAPREINIPINYEIITFLRKSKKSEEENIEQRVSIIDPNGVLTVDPLVVPIKTEKGKFNHRQIIKSIGFKITVAGSYQFIIELKQPEGKFEVVAMIPLEVTISRKNS